MSSGPIGSSAKLLAIAGELKARIPEFQDHDTYPGPVLVYPMFGDLALQAQDWLAGGPTGLVTRLFELVNEWCALDDAEVDNLLQTGFFEVLADKENLRHRTVELLDQRGRHLYAEIVEFFWGPEVVRGLGLEPSDQGPLRPLE